MKVRKLLTIVALATTCATPAFADSASGPATGTNAQPTANAGQSGDKSAESARGSSGAAVGAPGQPGKAGGESDPGTVKPPGQH